MTPDWLLYLSAIVLIPVLLYGLRWIFSLEPKDSPDKSATYIPVRRLGRVLEWTFVMFGELMLAGDLFEFLNGKGGSLWLAPFGLTVALFASYTVNTHLWLDAIGMHYRTGVARSRVIAWKDLDHYEQTVVRGRNAATRYFLFRSNDGATFWISKTNYDIDSLLALIREHANVNEQPYVNR
jgi:hypothetical protein